MKSFFHPPIGIVAFSGRAGVGKDLLCCHYQRMDKRVMRYAFADDLKVVYCQRAGITLEELEDNKEFHRQGLIDLAELDLKVGNPAYFGDRFVDKAMQGLFGGKLVNITDCRYPAETITVQEFARVKGIPFSLIRVHRPSIARINCGWSLEKLKHDMNYINRAQHSIDSNPDTLLLWQRVFCPILFGKSPIKAMNI